MYKHNLIVLKHFRGYPSLMDSVSNDIRYARLLKLIDEFNSKNTIFFSTTTRYDDRLESISEIAESEGFKWIEYTDDESIEQILSKCEGINFGPASNSNVVIGGTNTAGCLLRNSNVCANEWIERGFDVQMCLSICADYQLDGINTVEKNNMAMSILYNFAKNRNFIEKMDICYDVTELRRYE